MTVTQIVQAALRLLRVNGATADEISDGMQALNLMLQQWAIDGLYKVVRENFDLVAGTAAYNIGSGQTWDTALPFRIVKAFIRDSNSIDYGVNCYFSPIDYASKSLKSVQSRPTDLFFERYSSAYAVITLFPTPDDSSDDLYIYSHKPLATYSNVGSSLDLPFEYESAIKYSLALALAGEYGREASPLQISLANESIAALRRLQTHPVPRINTALGFGQPSGYDIESDLIR